jgi:hypothetical protein
MCFAWAQNCKHTTWFRMCLELYDYVWQIWVMFEIQVVCCKEFAYPKTKFLKDWHPLGTALQAKCQHPRHVKMTSYRNTCLVTATFDLLVSKRCIVWLCFVSFIHPFFRPTEVRRGILERCRTLQDLCLGKVWCAPPCHLLLCCFCKLNWKKRSDDKNLVMIMFNP